MRSSIFIFFFYLSVTCYSQVLFKIDKDRIYKFNYRDGDEFNSGKIDPEMWQYGMGWGNVFLRQNTGFSADNVILEDGIVRFISQKENKKIPINSWEIDSVYIKNNPRKIENGFIEVDHTSGCLSTKKAYRYGIFEIRFKAQEGKGTWPAYWLFGGKPNEEIDVFELKGERNNQIHVDVHCPNGCDKGYKKKKWSLKRNWGAWIKTKSYLKEEYTHMLVEWNEEGVRWFLNGYPVAYWKGNFNTHMNVLVNNMVAKDGEAFKPGPDGSTQWPNYFDVDFVRIWKSDSLRDSIIQISKKNDFSLSRDPDQILKNKTTKKIPFMYSKKKMNGTNGFLSIGMNMYGVFDVMYTGKPIEDEIKIELLSVDKQVISEIKLKGNHIRKDFGMMRGLGYLRTTYKGKVYEERIKLQ